MLTKFKKKVAVSLKDGNNVGPENCREFIEEFLKNDLMEDSLVSRNIF